MAQELIYTSFPKGVKPGVSGFCTVAVSPDLAPNMISRLEGLSGYRHLYMPGTPEADLNPPNWSHVVISVGNAESHVVYRVADAGLDYTGRSNKLAHFIVLDKNDLAPCGPAAMLTTPSTMDNLSLFHFCEFGLFCPVCGSDAGRCTRPQPHSGQTDAPSGISFPQFSQRIFFSFIKVGIWTS